MEEEEEEEVEEERRPQRARITAHTCHLQTNQKKKKKKKKEKKKNEHFLRQPQKEGEGLPSSVSASIVGNVHANRSLFTSTEHTNTSKSGFLFGFFLRFRLPFTFALPFSMTATAVRFFCLEPATGAGAGAGAAAAGDAGVGVGVAAAGDRGLEATGLGGATTVFAVPTSNTERAGGEHKPNGCKQTAHKTTGSHNVGSDLTVLRHTIIGE